MELGGCPPENEDELDENPRAALRKYLVLLQNKFPIPQELKGINRFSSKSFNLGEYSEAVMLYNEENKLSDRFASFVDKHLPLSWEDTDIPSFEEYCSWRDAQEDEALTLSDYDTTEGWDNTDEGWDDGTEDAALSLGVDLNSRPNGSVPSRVSVLKQFGLSDEEIKKLL